jgi:hypothetical protein
VAAIMGKRLPQGRTPLLRSAALLSLLAVTACVDQPTAPAVPDAAALAAPPAEGAVFSRGGQTRLNRNGNRYRDSGRHHHATGRSGSAQIQAVAVLHPDGVTRLTITTGDLDDPAGAPGYIARAQVKLSPAACEGGEGGSRGKGRGHGGEDDGEECRRTLNFNQLTEPTVTLEIPGLRRGDAVRIQANVRGVDGRRTDVVTLSAEVVLAPSVHVDLQVPPRVVVGTPTLVTATVTETAGDLGSGGDCELYADGVLVDRATGIWVDAGDAVTCAFTYTPDHAGEQDLEVRLSGPHGAAAGTSATDQATVDVVTPLATAWAASAEDRSVEVGTRFEYHWEKRDGSHKEYDRTEANTTRTQTVQVAGTLTRAAVFPLAAATLEFESGGIVWHQERWSELAGAADAQGRTCATQQIPAQGGVFYVCTSGAASTFGFTRFGGTVTYHATGFVNTFDGLTGTGEYFTFNEQYTTSLTGGQNRPWGSDVTVRLSVTDAQGTFAVQPVVPLAPFDAVTAVTPRTCQLVYQYWLEGNAQEECTSGQTREFGRRGNAQG